MTQQLNSQISLALASEDSARVERWEYLRADISHYVEGGRVTWDLMRWLCPHKFEHWELRSRRPRPSLRVFGRFAEPDVFVGTHVAERTSLKEKWNLQWELAKLSCEDYWKHALGDRPAFTAESYESYITENAYRHLKVPP